MLSMERTRIGTEDLQRLPIIVAQIHTESTGKCLLNEILQRVYLLYREKQISKQVYKNLMKFVKLRG